MNCAYDETYDELLALAARLDAVRRREDDSVDPHATAALHAIRFAAAMLQPRLPDSAPVLFPHSIERLLELAGNWREAALGLGDFAPAASALRLIPGREARQATLNRPGGGGDRHR